MVTPHACRDLGLGLKASTIHHSFISLKQPTTAENFQGSTIALRFSSASSLHVWKWILMVPMSFNRLSTAFGIMLSMNSGQSGEEDGQRVCAFYIHYGPNKVE
jgi:hypothetical protein